MRPAAPVRRRTRPRGGRRIRTRFQRIALGGALGLAVAACAQTPRAPDLAGMYDAAAQRHDPDRNPVVVIPGLLGSKLVDSRDGAVVWGAFDVGPGGGGREAVLRLALPMRAGVEVTALTDPLVPDGALDRVRVRWLGLPLQLKAYAYILATLGVGGYRDQSLGLAGAVDYGSDHYTCFQFDYDWRRDIPENARRLAAFLAAKEAYVREEYERRNGVPLAGPVRFDVVAHSMGGLVLRWYLRYGTAEPGPAGALPEITWAGAARVERAILIGTPNLGALSALENLVEGYDPGWLVPEFPPAVVGTLPALYELLPRGRHRPLLDREGRAVADLFDPAFWERERLGLADPGQDGVLRRLLPDAPSAQARRRIALDHLGKCLRRARAVTAALDVPAEPPAGTELFAIAGDAIPTAAVLRLEPDRSRLAWVRGGPGDGTVLRASVLGDERLGTPPSDPAWRPRLDSPIRWRQVLLLFSEHLDLTRDPVFLDNVLFLLLEDERERPTAPRATPTTGPDRPPRESERVPAPNGARSRPARGSRPGSGT